jgi:hypothetical protein
MVIASMKATVILLKTVLEEMVLRLHVPHHQIEIRVRRYNGIHGHYVTGHQIDSCQLVRQQGHGSHWDKVLHRSRIIVGGGDKLKVYKGIDFSSRQHGGDVKRNGVCSSWPFKFL